MLNTNLFLKLTRHEVENGIFGILLSIRPRVICKDGFNVSIQASDRHYCSPRTSEVTVYDCVELGFPSEKEDLIMDYAEDNINPTDTVYTYVPIDVVDKMLEKHGGIVDIYYD